MTSRLAASPSVSVPYSAGTVQMAGAVAAFQAMFHGRPRSLQNREGAAFAPALTPPNLTFRAVVPVPWFLVATLLDIDRAGPTPVPVPIEKTAQEKPCLQLFSRIFRFAHSINNEGTTF